MEQSFRNIKDDYKLIQTLGRGNFAHVKLARHRMTGVCVAVKIFMKRNLDKLAQKVLNTEVELLQQVDHPNIVRLFDVYEDERSCCLVLEYMAGGSLADLLGFELRLQEDDSRRHIISIIGALRHCHEMGIMHRDLKLDNLLLSGSDQNTVKLADFGFAKKFTNL
jgi:calcium/calmodulin-dependent protein kinase I